MSKICFSGKTSYLYLWIRYFNISSFSNVPISSTTCCERLKSLLFFSSFFKKRSLSIEVTNDEYFFSTWFKYLESLIILFILKSVESNFFSKLDENNVEFRKLLFDTNNNVLIFETKYILKNLEKFDLNDQYLVFSGIGNHRTFIDMLNKYKFKIFKDLEFPDHYKYHQKDLENINLLAKKENLKILTTKKDYLRISLKNKKDLSYVDIKLKINDYDNFKKEILKVNEIN